jgi:choline-sulfatase
MEERDHFESFVARESIRFFEKYTGENQPFLLVSSLLKPHDPFMPATRFAEMFEADKMKLSKTWGKADLEHLPRPMVEQIETCRWTPELLHASAARERMAAYYGSLAQ